MDSERQPSGEDGVTWSGFSRLGAPFLKKYMQADRNACRIFVARADGIF